MRLAGAVVAVEHGSPEDEHVAQDRPDQAHGDDVDEPGRVAERGRLRQRAEQGHPDAATEDEEGGELDRPDPLVAKGELVRRRPVPAVEVDRPADDRDHGIGEDAQPPDRAQLEQRGDQGGGQAEDDQERADVAEEQELGHVRHQQLLAERAERRHQCENEDEQAAPEARELPPRDGLPFAGNGPAAMAVQEPEEQRERDRSVGPGRADRCERREAQRLGAHRTT